MCQLEITLCCLLKSKFFTFFVSSSSPTSSMKSLIISNLVSHFNWAFDECILAWCTQNFFFFFSFIAVSHIYYNSVSRGRSPYAYELNFNMSKNYTIVLYNEHPCFVHHNLIYSSLDFSYGIKLFREISNGFYFLCYLFLYISTKMNLQ